jgi:hypothetical protein
LEESLFVRWQAVKPEGAADDGAAPVAIDSASWLLARCDQSVLAQHLDAAQLNAFSTWVLEAPGGGAARSVAPSPSLVVADAPAAAVDAAHAIIEIAAEQLRAGAVTSRGLYVHFASPRACVSGCLLRERAGELLLTPVRVLATARAADVAELVLALEARADAAHATGALPMAAGVDGVCFVVPAGEAPELPAPVPGCPFFVCSPAPGPTQQGSPASAGSDA